MSDSTAPQDSAAMSPASAGSGGFRVIGALHWSCRTEKGRQRISTRVDLRMPFAPFVGMHFAIDHETPCPKIKEVEWLHSEQLFHIYGTVRLNRMDSKSFELLVGEIREAGPEYDPKLHDDNWMYGQ